jgi:2-C-methyl-D-erythritol 4-phosphate cytidylyltransferase
VTTTAILTAAGSGDRLGHPIPKALVPIADAPLVVHAARRLLASNVVDALVVTAPPGVVGPMARVLHDAGIEPVIVIAGGATRQESVAAGLEALPPGAGDDVVIVHDAARPFAPVSLIRRVVRAVREGHSAVIPALPVADTIKQISAGDRVEYVVGTPDRSVLRAVQTPQGFSRALLEQAHAVAAQRPASDHATDDAGLVEELGEAVVVIRGSSRAMKITTQTDLRIASALFDEEPI